MNKIDKDHLWIVFGLCLILAIAIKIVYLSQLGDERLKHTATSPFLPVVATMDTYQEYEVVERETDDDGYTREYRTTKYNITYAYVVNDTTYYMTEYDKNSLVDKVGIYYNSNNPNQISYYATYEEAVEGLKIYKIISDVFIVLSIIMGFLSIYRTFIYKPPSELGGMVIKDDFKAFVELNQYDDKESNKQEKMLKAETIAFPGKKSTGDKFELYTEQEYKDMMKKENGNV